MACIKLCKDFINENHCKGIAYYKYEDWTSKKANTLFVCGYSGSGKSTIGKKIAKENAAYYVELDNFYESDSYGSFTNEINSSLWEKFYKSFYYEKFREKNVIVKEKTWEDPDFVRKIFKEFFLFRIDYAIKDKQNKYVLEGVQFVFYEDLFSTFSKYPMMVIGTSLIKSSIRRALRNYKEYKYDKDSKVKFIFLCFYEAFKDNIVRIDRRLKKLKKYLGVACIRGAEVGLK